MLRHAPTALVTGALLFTAACGSGVSADTRNAKEVAAGSGVKADVSCDGASCSVSWHDRVHSATEAEMIVLPIVTWVNGDPELRSIRALALRITDTKTNRDTRFRCALRHNTPTQSTPTQSSVSSVREMCRLVTA